MGAFKQLSLNLKFRITYTVIGLFGNSEYTTTVEGSDAHDAESNLLSALAQRGLSACINKIKEVKND